MNKQRFMLYHRPDNFTYRDTLMIGVRYARRSTCTYLEGTSVCMPASAHANARTYCMLHAAHASVTHASCTSPYIVFMAIAIFNTSRFLETCYKTNVKLGPDPKIGRTITSE